MDTTKRSPLDRLLFATFLKGRTSSRDIWEEKGDMTPEDNKKIIEETNEIINDDSTYPYLSYLTELLAKSKPAGESVKKLHEHIDTIAISIHALREEGDIFTPSMTSTPSIFLSTPSARRAAFSCLCSIVVSSRRNAGIIKFHERQFVQGCTDALYDRQGCG